MRHKIDLSLWDKAKTLIENCEAMGITIKAARGHIQRRRLEYVKLQGERVNPEFKEDKPAESSDIRSHRYNLTLWDEPCTLV